jgi:hypothetical protein
MQQFAHEVFHKFSGFSICYEFVIQKSWGEQNTDSEFSEHFIMLISVQNKIKHLVA